MEVKKEAKKEAKKEEKKGFFTDNAGNPSAMRLMSMMAFWVSAVIAFVNAFNLDGSSETSVDLALYFLIAAFTPKTVQKFVELKGESLGK